MAKRIGGQPQKRRLLPGLPFPIPISAEKAVPAVRRAPPYSPVLRPQARGALTTSVALALIYGSAVVETPPQGRQNLSQPQFTRTTPRTYPQTLPPIYSADRPPVQTLAQQPTRTAPVQVISGQNLLPTYAQTDEQPRGSQSTAAPDFRKAQPQFAPPNLLPTYFVEEQLPIGAAQLSTPRSQAPAIRYDYRNTLPLLASNSAPEPLPSGAQLTTNPALPLFPAWRYGYQFIPNPANIPPGPPPPPPPADGAAGLGGYPDSVIVRYRRAVAEREREEARLAQIREAEAEAAAKVKRARTERTREKQEGALQQARAEAQQTEFAIAALALEIEALMLQVRAYDAQIAANMAEEEEFALLLALTLA